MLSRFFHYSHIDDNVYAVFNSLIMDVLYVDSNELDRIMECDETLSFSHDLYKSGIFVQKSDIDDHVFHELYSLVHQQDRKLDVLYLDLSSSCNLACKYCFIHNNEQNNSTEGIHHMPFNIAKIAVDKFLSSCIESIDVAQITLFGGEPLLNWDTLDKIVRYIREKAPYIKITLITNATLLSSDKIIFLKDFNVGIGISLDGPKAINDDKRVFLNGVKSVYDCVLGKIDILNRLKAHYCISATITDELINSKDNLITWLTNIGCHSIFWNIFHYSNNSEKWSEYYEKMSVFILEMNELLEAHNISDEKLREQIDLFFRREFKFHNCGAVGLNQITVKPNGDITICQGDLFVETMTIGNIITDELTDLLLSNKVAWWTEIHTVDRRECLDCEALHVCGGGCPLQSEALFNSRTAIDKASCIYYKSFLHWLLKKYYQCGVFTE